MSIKVYEVITDQITAKLAAGVCPWRMPWAKLGTSPRSIRGRKYTGCNYFLLSMLGFADPTFLTYKQAQAIGGNVKKGEKGFPVIFWKFIETVEDGVKTTIPMLRYFTVFNVSQCEGIKYTAPVVPEKPEFQGIEAAEKIAAGFNGPSVSFGGDRACYRKDADAVTVPNKAQFETEGEFYSTLFHELGHSTGHPSRLNRKELGSGCFGSMDYSLEELTAELTASFLCAEAGIDGTLDNSAAYIGSWLKKLNEDPKCFVSAAGKAQKAANMILGRKANEEAEEEAA